MSSGAVEGREGLSSEHGLCEKPRFHSNIGGHIKGARSEARPCLCLGHAERATMGLASEAELSQPPPPSAAAAAAHSHSHQKFSQIKTFAAKNSVR